MLFCAYRYERTSVYNAASASLASSRGSRISECQLKVAQSSDDKLMVVMTAVKNDCFLRMENKLDECPIGSLQSNSRKIVT